MLSAESFPHWKPCLFLLFSSFIPTSLQLSPPWHSIIKLARTSRFPVPRVRYPITRRQFVLCEDNINISILKYWDVKFHTGPLMHSGNHSLLLRLPATQLSEDHVTGEGKSDSLTFSLSLSFLTMTSFTYSVPLWALSFPLSISLLCLRGVSLHRAPWQGDWWGGLTSLTVDIYQETLLGMPTLLASPQTNRQLDSWRLPQNGMKLSHLTTL